MHAIPFDVGPFVVSIIIAVATGLYIGRGVHQAGVERYGGRILISSAVINVGIIALLLLLLGAAGLRGALMHSRIHVVDGAVALFLLILPVRAIWDYATTPGRITRQAGLKSLGNQEHRREIAAVAEMMGIRTPSMRSSPLYRAPFVFGRSSGAACIVIPETWSAVEANSRHVMLCHEFAHIRNSDVGFMTWSLAFVRDLKWLLLLSPAIVLLSLFSRQKYLPQVAVLYVGCLLILWSTTNAVLRSRELLADATVAMLIESGQIVRTIEEILLVPMTGLHSGNMDSPGLIVHARRWLADKAMFSKHATFWRAMARSVEWSLDTHPSIAVRRNVIRGGHAVREDSSVRNGEAFWAGLTLGLLGVLIALGGFWTGKFILGWQDEEQVVRLSYNCGGSVAPLATVFVALFFVLPAWSSLRPQVPTGRSLARLLTRYLYGLLGASSVLPLIFLGGWSHLGIRLLFVLAVLWVHLILAMGITVNFIMLSLWLSLRYKRKYYFIDLVWTLYSHSLALLAMVCYFGWGLVLLQGDQALAGGSVECGFLIGLALSHALSKDSLVSGTDQYAVIAVRRVLITLEGRTYRRWSPLVGSLFWIGSCIAPAIIISAILYKGGDGTLGHVDRRVAALILLVLGCAIFLFIDWRWPRRMCEPGRQKTCTLAGALILLHHRLSVESREIINRLLSGLLVQHDEHGRSGTMTTQKMFEFTLLASQGERSRHLWEDRARQWAYACETATGFGVWPAGGSRLSSTYQCLQVLANTGGIQFPDPNCHVAWIRSLQMPDGSFRGPWSYRSRWEDTFFAAAALNLLGSGLDEQARAHCLTWLKETLVHEGMEKGQLDAFHHCLAAAHALHGLDDEMAHSAGQWLSLELDRLLLTHVAHNAANICHAVCAHHILEQRGISLFRPERMDLLAARIAAALEAELTALRI